MKVCPTCTSSVAEKANFCPDCGHGFVSRNTTPDIVEVAPERPTSQENSTQSGTSNVSRGEDEATRAIPDSQSPPPPPSESIVPRNTEPQMMELDNTAISPSPVEREVPNFLSNEPLSEDEELTRVQPQSQQDDYSHRQDALTERQDGTGVKRKAERRGLDEGEGFRITHDTIPSSPGHRSHRKWLLLSILGILVTAVALIVVVQGGSEREKPYGDAPPDVETETIAPESKSKASDGAQGEQPVIEEAEPEAAGKKPEPKEPEYIGPWVLDVEARLQAPEFADMPEAERNLFRSMMKKKNNQTSVLISADKITWTETGTSTDFAISEAAMDGGRLTFSIESKNGKVRKLNGELSGEKMTLDDPFGSGSRQFIRQRN